MLDLLFKVEEIQRRFELVAQIERNQRWYAKLGISTFHLLLHGIEETGNVGCCKGHSKLTSKFFNAKSKIYLTFIFARITGRTK